MLYLLGKERQNVPLDELLEAVEEFSKLYPDGFDKSVLEMLDDFEKEKLIELDLPYVRITHKGIVEGVETFSKLLEEDYERSLAILLAVKTAQKRFEREQNR